MKETIHVAIVEDDQEIRHTLALIIDGTPGYRCQHVFDSAERAMESLPDLGIEVVLMDIELPGISGIEAIRQLKPQLENTDFLMLTVREDDASVFESLCAGASGYLMKYTPPARLLQSIDEVFRGGAPMSSNIAKKVVKSFQQEVPVSPLSERETEILALLCDGLNYRSIAEKLFLSTHTVRSHIKNIYKKLHVNSRAEAVKKALKDKLL